MEEGGEEGWRRCGPLNTAVGQSVWLLTAWIGIWIGYILWRSNQPLVWSDTPLISANVFECCGLRWEGLGTLRVILSAAFNDVTAEGYRPLSKGVALLGTAVLSERDDAAVWWYAFVGGLLGASAVFFFLVARRLLGSGRGAAIAVFLFLFTPAVIAGSWVVFSGIQIVVPLFLSAGLFLYWKYHETGGLRRRYCYGLCVIMFVAPWFREFIGILALLVILLEFQRVRRPTLLAGVAAAALLHAVYPTSLVALLVSRELPVTSIFSMGFLGAQLGAGKIGWDHRFWQLLLDFRWAMPVQFVTLWPPVLLLVGAIALVLDLRRSIGRLWPRQCSAGARGAKCRRELIATLGIAGGGTSVAAILALEGDGGEVAALAAALGLAVLGFRRNAFVGIWFAVTFLPFLKVFTEHVHLAYPAMPASIILADAIEQVWNAARGLGRLSAVARYAVGIVLAVGAGDHALNAYGSHRVVSSVNLGIIEVAKWFRANVPAGSIVVTNAIHGEDIRLASGGHVKVYYTVEAGVASDCDVVAEPEALEDLLQKSRGRRDVYFLDVDFRYPPEKELYHSHKYVRAASVAVEDLGVAHVTRVRYPYLDPLKGLLAGWYVHFLGAPDLENDFYHGAALDGAPMMREVYAEYGVYRVVGTSVSRWEPKGALELVIEGYRGFNVLKWNGRYFAIPQGEGPFELRRFQRGDYSRRFAADALESLLGQIDAAGDGGLNGTEGCSELGTAAVVHRGYRGFTLVRCGRWVYAVPHGASIDCSRVCGAPLLALAGESVVSAMGLVDLWLREVAVGKKQGEPYMVREGYRGYNILLLGGRYYAVAQSEGAVTASRLRRGRYSSMVSADTYDEVVRRVDEVHEASLAERRFERPVLLRHGYKGFDIVGYGSRIYGVPQELGHLTLAGAGEWWRAKILVGASKDGVVRQIDRVVALRETSKRAQERRIPSVLETSYSGFDLVAYEGRVYGIPTEYGGFDAKKLRRGEYRDLVVGCSVDAVKRVIRRTRGTIERRAWVTAHE